MYSLHLNCAPEQVDDVSAELWAANTCGIREVDLPDGRVDLIAAFERNDLRSELMQTFAAFAPQWSAEADTDWVLATRNAWPGRSVGARFFLAPPWCEEATPAGRMRLVHNPGLACGTGEHPCTRLALEALERFVTPSTTVADIGTGSGILAIAALQLGARTVAAVDLDEAALHPARENCALNELHCGLAVGFAVGSASCLRDQSADLVVANISPSILLSLADDLLRIARPAARLILTGFQEVELEVVAKVFPAELILQEDAWVCLISRASS